MVSERLGKAITQVKCAYLIRSLSNDFLLTSSTLAYEALDTLLQLIGLLIPPVTKPGQQSPKRQQFIDQVFGSSSPQTSVSQSLVQIVSESNSKDWEQTCHRVVKTLAASDVNLLVLVVPIHWYRLQQLIQLVRSPQPFTWSTPICCGTPIKQFPENGGFYIDKRCFYATVQHHADLTLAESCTIPFTVVGKVAILAPEKKGALITPVGVSLRRIPESLHLPVGRTVDRELKFMLNTGDLTRFREGLVRRGLVSIFFRWVGYVLIIRHSRRTGCRMRNR